MDAIYDSDGKEIGSIALSDKQQAAIEAGEEIVVIYHTPQLLRSLLGERSGSFTLRKIHQRIETNEPDVVKHFAELQKAITAAKTREAS